MAEGLATHIQSASYVLPETLSDYVSETLLTLPGTAPLHLFNVHASPRPVDEPAAFLEWKRDAERHVFHADVVASVLAARAGEGADVLAVGDFNEAWLWDDKHGTSSSREFFDRMASNGLIDVTMRHWGGEVTTQVKHPYQVDRLFATKGVELVLAQPTLSIGPPDELSDHMPVTFILRR